MELIRQSKIYNWAGVDGESGGRLPKEVKTRPSRGEGKTSRKVRFTVGTDVLQSRGN